jgi:hypothetical protein
MFNKIGDDASQAFDVAWQSLIHDDVSLNPIYYEDVGRLDTIPHIEACVLQALLVKYVTLCQSANAAERRFKKTSLVPEMPSWESRNRENGNQQIILARFIFRLIIQKFKIYPKHAKYPMDQNTFSIRLSVAGEGNDGSHNQRN